MKKRISKKITIPKKQLNASQVQLLHSNRIHTLGLIAAGVVHELNNPMMGILNFAQYCLLHTPENDKRYPVLQDIERTTNRCIQIVQHLLSVSRIESIEDEPFVKGKIDSIIHMVLQLLSYTIIKQHVTVSQSIEDNLPDIHFRRGGIQQLVFNLILIALDVVRNIEKKEIHIHINKNEITIQMIIACTGSRITFENTRRQFNSFGSSEMIEKEVNLRLSVCQSIVQMHGGDMSIEHKSNCTQFTILLPVKQGEKK